MKTDTATDPPRHAAAPVIRFAPSPTGHLHLGHAFSALSAWHRARAAGGRFLLRLEDIDATRCREEFAAAILEDLAWLGLEWDGPVRVQSAHMAEYRAVLDWLRGRGLLYPCFCTRADIRRELSAPHGPEGPVYPGTCRHLGAAARAAKLASGMAHAWRLDMEAALEVVGGPLRFHDETAGWVAADPGPFGDVVLARKDVPASYHLCVTHDDALQGITLVVRGVDLFAATHVHVLLQALMGWPTPGYAHHRLLSDATGKRLAKRDRAATLRDLRAAGRSPADVQAMVGVPGA